MKGAVNIDWGSSLPPHPILPRPSPPPQPPSLPSSLPILFFLFLQLGSKSQSPTATCLFFFSLSDSRLDCHPIPLSLLPILAAHSGRIWMRACVRARVSVCVSQCTVYQNSIKKRPVEGKIMCNIMFMWTAFGSLCLLDLCAFLIDMFKQKFKWTSETK